MKPNIKDPSIPGYSILRRDRPGAGGGGGVAILVHTSVSYVPIDTSNIIHNDIVEAQGIVATINNAPFSVINVYVPPSSACPRGFQPDVASILACASEDCFILGDWNAHHDAWHSHTDDDRGEHLVDEIESSNFCILNQNQPTRLPQGRNNNQRPSSPDISLVSAHLTLAVSWSTETTMSSDHLPIAISFVGDTPSPQERKTYINFHRADWDGFRTELESLVANLRRPTSCAEGEKRFRTAVETAAKHHIPAGYRKDYIPGKNREAEHLESEYDEVRRQDPQDPALEDLDREIRRVRNESSRNRWKSFVE